MQARLMKISAALALALLAAPALAQTGTQTDTPKSAPSLITTAPATPPPATATPGTATTKLTRAQEFTTAAAATASCPGDTVVWSSLSKKSRNFHLAGSRYFGKTKHGAYVCEKAALAAGFHQAKS